MFPPYNPHLAVFSNYHERLIEEFDFSRKGYIPNKDLDETWMGIDFQALSICIGMYAHPERKVTESQREYEKLCGIVPEFSLLARSIGNSLMRNPEIDAKTLEEIALRIKDKKSIDQFKPEKIALFENFVSLLGLN